MAINYCGTNNTIDSLGGTKKYSIGASGTFSIDTTYIGTMIERAENLINLYLDPIYGTQHFGSNANGTRGVPAIVKDITADLSAWLVLDNKTQPITDKREVDFGERLYKRAMNLLEQLASGELKIPDYSPEETNLPVSTDFEFDVVDDVVKLTGTEITDLKWTKIIPYSDSVWGTEIDSTTQYTRNTDYRIYYWDDPIGSGTMAGHMRRIGTTITDGQYVLVKYKVYKDHVFGIRDARLYGHKDSGLGYNSAKMGY